jgi:hypothetical protein
MIQPNEVRLGNWIMKVPEKRYLQLQDIIQTEYSYLLNGLGLEFFRAILLTPELLMKSGFKNQYDCWYIGDFVLRESFEELFYHPNGKNVGQQIEYLHQLQNIYFVITAEELEIDI